MEDYRSDLAFIHDVGFDFFSRGAAPWLLQTFEQRGFFGARLLDLGCGSGIWAKEASDHGFDVVGVDLSPAMIAIARKRAPSAEFRVGSLHEVELPRCDIVTSLGECLNYRFDPRAGRRALPKLFRRVRRALSAGGLFVFDVAEPGRAKVSVHRHFEGEDWALMLDTAEDPKTETLTRRITTFRRRGRSFRRDHEVHELKLYPAADVAQMLRDTGFRVRVLRRYGDLAFPKGYAGFLATPA